MLSSEPRHGKISSGEIRRAEVIFARRMLCSRLPLRNIILIFAIILDLAMVGVTGYLSVETFNHPSRIKDIFLAERQTMAYLDSGQLIVVTRIRTHQTHRSWRLLCIDIRYIQVYLPDGISYRVVTVPLWLASGVSATLTILLFGATILLVRQRRTSPEHGFPLSQL
jgi:hypothetical protein